jgi:hypothetical protein
LPKQAGVIEQDQGDAIVILSWGFREVLPAEPRQWQGRERSSRPGATGLKERQGHVETPGIHVVLERVVAARPHFDMNSRPPPRKARDRVRHHVFEEVLGESHSDRSGSSRCAQSGSGLVVQFDDPASIGQECIPSLGRDKAASIPLEQRMAGLLLKALQLHADRRLRAADLDGGTSKAPNLRPDNDRAQGIDIEGGSHLSDSVKWEFSTI